MARIWYTALMKTATILSRAGIGELRKEFCSSYLPYCKIDSRSTKFIERFKLLFVVKLEMLMGVSFWHWSGLMRWSKPDKKNFKIVNIVGWCTTLTGNKNPCAVESLPCIYFEEYAGQNFCFFCISFIYMHVLFCTASIRLQKSVHWANAFARLVRSTRFISFSLPQTLKVEIN